MKNILINYIANYMDAPKKCKKFLLIYSLQSLAGGMAFFIAFYFGASGLKFTPETIGYLISGLAFGSIAGAFVMGKFADNKNASFLSFLSLFIQGLCFVLISITKSIPSMAVIMFVFGASNYAYLAISEYHIASIAGDGVKEKANAFSLQNVASNVGTVIGGVIIASIPKSLAGSVFLITGSGLIILSIIFLFDIRSKALVEREIDSKDIYRSDRALYIFSLVFIFMLGVVFAQQRVGYPIYLKLNLSNSLIDFILIANSLFIILFMPSISNFIVRLNHVKTMGAGGFLLAGGMFLFGHFTSVLSIMIICIIATIGEVVSILLSQFCCFQSVENGKKGKAMGAFKGCYATGTALGAILGGKIQNMYGINLVWELCGVIGIAMLVSAFLFNVKYKKVMPLTA